MYIYIYIKYPLRWQKLPSSARTCFTALSYRNCVITLGWRLMRAGYHTLYDERNSCIYPSARTGYNLIFSSRV